MKASKIISGSVLALSLSLPASSVFADDVNETDVRERAYPVEATTYTGAQSPAEALRTWQDKLATYRRMGSPAVKSGLVERAQREVAHYQRLVDEEAGVVKVVPTTSPEAAWHEARVERLRRMGGIAHKVGLVQEAETQARKAGSQEGLVETNVSIGESYPSSGKTIESVRARPSS